MSRFGPRTPDKAVRLRLSRLRRERMEAARALGTHTEAEWTALVAYCGGRCVRCSSAESVQKDHIKLVARGGSDSIENLQPLCRRCNCGKSLDDTDHRPPGWRVAVLEAAS